MTTRASLGQDWVDKRPKGRLQEGNYMVKRAKIHLKGEDWVVKQAEIRLKGEDWVVKRGRIRLQDEDWVEETWKQSPNPNSLRASGPICHLVG